MKTSTDNIQVILLLHLYKSDFLDIIYNLQEEKTHTDKVWLQCSCTSLENQIYFKSYAYRVAALV